MLRIIHILGSKACLMADETLEWSKVRICKENSPYKAVWRGAAEQESASRGLPARGAHEKEDLLKKVEWIKRWVENRCNNPPNDRSRGTRGEE